MSVPADKPTVGRIVLYRSALGIEPAIIIAVYGAVPTGAPVLTSARHVHLTRFTTDSLTQGAAPGTHPGGATQAFNCIEDALTGGVYVGAHTLGTWRWPDRV